MGELKLVIPTMEYEEQVMKIRESFFKNNEKFSGCALLEECETYSEWIDFNTRLSKKYGDAYVPSTVYLCVRCTDNKVVGIIDFRHYLSEFLLNYGGNIGYSIVIDERRKGYGKSMLNMLLEKCKELKLEKILITCDKSNIASSKTIKACGGVLENEIIDDVGLGKSGFIQRYWINL